MYERFTDRARKVMQLANQETQRFHHEYIGTEHVLLGLIKEGSGCAANILRNLDIRLDSVIREIERLVQPGPAMVTLGKLPQTPRTKRAIENAIAISNEFGHNYVGTEHLLLGLLREEEGVAALVLKTLGVTFTLVAATFREIQESRGRNPAATSPSPANTQITYRQSTVRGQTLGMILAGSHILGLHGSPEVAEWMNELPNETKAALADIATRLNPITGAVEPSGK